MTNRRDEMYNLERYHKTAEEATDALLGSAEDLLNKLLDAEDTIEEQAKRIDLLETELDDANTLIADLKEDINEYRSGAQLREGWEL